MKKEEIKRVLVELDCLLDTRLGTIEKHYPWIANKLYTGTEYFEREMDDWFKLSDGKITQAFFEKAYASRDQKTLELSRPTRMLGFLNKLTQDLDLAKVTSPDIDLIEVVVNIHPYTLSTEAQETLATLVYSYCAIGTKVTTTSLDYASITPNLMRDNYDGVVLYDFNKWFSIHAQTLNRVLIPRNSLFAPALYIRAPEALFEQAPEEFKGISPFAQLEMSMIERLGLELLRAKEFSIVPFTA